MLLQEKVKKYITSGDETDGYVYRKDNHIWFVALQADSKRYFHSRLVGNNVSNCSYFVHKNIEEVEYFVKNLLDIEKYLVEHDIPFENFISLYWNPITDFLLFGSNHITDSELTTYLDKLIKNWKVKIEKHQQEFETLVIKKRDKWDEYTIWDDEKLYELAKKYNFLIPEDVLKSKNSVMLESMIENSQKILDLLENEK